MDNEDILIDILKLRIVGNQAWVVPLQQGRGRDLAVLICHLTLRAEVDQGKGFGGKLERVSRFGDVVNDDDASQRGCNVQDGTALSSLQLIIIHRAVTRAK